MMRGRAIVGFALVWATVLLLPAGAGAVDSDLKFAYAFKLDGSNGYKIVALAANERADGRGQIVFFVGRGRETAFYVAPAQLTATSVEASLGELGSVSLEATPSGRTKELSGCGEDRRPVAYEPVRYNGTVEFHGEEGYTEAASNAPREFTSFFSRALCASIGVSEIGGDNLPGAKLQLRSRSGDYGLQLQVNKNRPDKRSWFEVKVREKRGRISISRSASRWLGSGAFQYDPLLDTATLEPPAPFSGRASFHRGLVPARRWSGNLTVDLPGRSDVPLTGPGIQAALSPACLFIGPGPNRC
jgi:hypothetical protein